jgi:Putative restriction endonuclease
MVATPTRPTSLAPTYKISWEKPPEDFELDDTPVENTSHPLLAGAIHESLELTGRLQAHNFVASNFGLCAKIEDELVIKAPDWLYVPQVRETAAERKTYTPHLEGDVPSIVIEFLSQTDGGEYSRRPLTPVGKWFFYEKVLAIPTYIIFAPELGLLEVYRLQSGQYLLEQPDENGHHWFEELQLFLGAWRGDKEGRWGYWLRWWNGDRTLLPWGVELVAAEREKTEQERERAEQERERAEQERERAEQERERAEQERERADRLAELLRAQGIDPDSL